MGKYFAHIFPLCLCFSSHFFIHYKTEMAQQSKVSHVLMLLVQHKQKVVREHYPALSSSSHHEKVSFFISFNLWPTRTTPPLQLILVGVLQGGPMLCFKYKTSTVWAPHITQLKSNQGKMTSLTEKDKARVRAFWEKISPKVDEIGTDALAR